MPDVEGSTRPGPFFTTWGPLDGPIRYHDQPPALGVIASLDEAPMPIGIAYPVGWMPDSTERPPVATFRLEIGKTELPGLYVCVGRRFIPVEDWG